MFTVDKAAPRYNKQCLYTLEKRMRYKERVVTNTLFDNLREAYPNLQVYTDEQIKDVIRSFNELQAQALIDNRDGISLPQYIGNIIILSIDGKKGTNVKKVQTDWKKTREKGRRVYYDNSHTAGYVGGAHYIPNMVQYKFPNCDYWYFTPCRHVKRTMALAYVADWKKYIIVPTRVYARDFMIKFYKQEKTKIIEE